jgi:precorrin isomerase
MPAGFVDAAEFKQELGETAVAPCITAPGLKREALGTDVRVNPM